MAPEADLSFGPFSLRNCGETLYRDKEPVRLGSRARHILMVLATRAGEVVSKNDLLAAVWPETVVEEASLRVQLSALRTALADGKDGAQYIVNVPGRGYRFVAPVEIAAPRQGSRSIESRTDNLPSAVGRLIGRDEAVATLVKNVLRHRLLTLLGPGGVGKTSASLAAGVQLRAEFPAGIQFVDLAPLQDPALIAPLSPTLSPRS